MNFPFFCGFFLSILLKSYHGVSMRKKIFLSVILGLFTFVITSSAFEYQGKTVTEQQIQSLSPQQLKQLKQLMPSGQDKVSTGDSQQQEIGKSKIEDSTNKLTEDALTGETDGTEKEDEKEDEKDAKFKKTASSIGSKIEQQYRQGYASTISSRLNQFGYDIFKSASMGPSSLAVPDSNYILGTGDQLLIRLWGSGLDAEYSATIDRQGSIQLPKIGVIPLAGVQLGSAESILLRAAQKYVQGININVTLTRLRSLEIFVVGAVKNPGLHLIPAFSTVFDGLLAAGGVKKSGTLRQIQLKRADKKSTFDIYDLLLKGDRGADKILHNRDVIFVPGIGKTAAIAGAVNNEGIFELTGKKSIKDIVEMAGGILPQAYGYRIYLRRFENNEMFVINDINTASMEEWKKIKIQNGDLVEITFSSSLLPNVVKLQGHVWAPDVFNFKNGMKLSQVLTSPGLLKPDAVTDFAIIDRYDINSSRSTPMQFPLSKVFTGEYDVLLQPFDTIKILSRAVIGIKENYSITGAVWKPGQYAYKPGLKLEDALAIAGGLKSEARTDRIEIKRKIKTRTKFETEYIEIDLTDNPGFNLQHKDMIMIPSLKDYFVNLEGHIHYPEKIQYYSGIKLSDVLISRDLPKPEDLLKPDALTDFGLIERYDAETTETRSIQFPLADVFQGKYDTVLQPFDKIKILSRKDFGIDENYSINGAVWKTGEFDFHKGLNLKDAVALAGGLKFGARKDNIEIARQIIQDNRIVTKFFLLNLDSDEKFLINPFDSIMIPMMKDAAFARKVKITGEVAYPGIYTVKQDEKLSDLIQRSGGFTEHAYFYGAKYTSEQAQMIQQQSINQMIDQLELSLIQVSSEMTQSALSPEDVQAAELSLKQTSGFVEKLKKIKAEGRISIHIADLASFKNSLYDFTLKPGDALHIPERPSFVSVVGSVYSPGSFLYEPSQPLKFYLSKSGGIAKTADEDHVYLLKANGEILSVSQSKGFFSDFEDTILMPGDTIVVPEDLDRVPYIKLIADIADIAFKIATTAGVAISLAL